MFDKGRKKGSLRFMLTPAGKPKAVAVAGDFCKWKPQAMRKQKDGSYMVELEVPAGSHEYKFVVDGDWVTDPDVSNWVMNPFGTVNSVAVVK